MSSPVQGESRRRTSYVIEAVLPPDDTGLRHRLYFGPVRGLAAARRAEDAVFDDEALDASAVSIVPLRPVRKGGS